MRRGQIRLITNNFRQCCCCVFIIKSFGSSRVFEMPLDSSDLLWRHPTARWAPSLIFISLPDGLSVVSNPPNCCCRSFRRNRHPTCTLCFRRGGTTRRRPRWVSMHRATAPCSRKAQVFIVWLNSCEDTVVRREAELRPVYIETVDRSNLTTATRGEKAI